MSESLVDPPAVPQTRRRWLIAATVGVAMVGLPMIVMALVLGAKPQFGWLVGSWFLAIIASGVIVGGLVVAIAAWNLPIRKSWRGIVLMIWGLVALTSPAMGWLFLLPWGVLALFLPVVIAILIGLYKAA